MREVSKPVVTISSTYGAGGTVIGPAVARRLHLPYLDRIVSADVARRASAPVADEERLTDDERSDSFLRRVVDSMASVPAVFGGVISPLEDGLLNDDPVWERVAASIVKMADETGGVVVGRGAACVLRAHAGALHVRLDGPRERRVAQAMQIESVDEAEARRRQAVIDRARALYVKRFYDADCADPRLYHVVLDSTAIPFDACIDIIVRAAHARWRSLA